MNVIVVGGGPAGMMSAISSAKGKNKVILPKKKVKIVYEFPINYFDFKVNTKIEVIE